MPTGLSRIRATRFLFGFLCASLLLFFLWRSPRTRSWSSSQLGVSDATGGHDPIQDVKAVPHDDFKHTRYFHAPDVPALGKVCAEVETENILTAVRDSHAIDAPTAFHFHRGLLLRESEPREVGAWFCAIFSIPQTAWEGSSAYRPEAVQGMGPDAIVAEMTSADVKLVFTEHPKFRSMEDVDGRDIAIYAAPYSLNHPGSYQMSAIAELPNYQWTQEDPITLVFKTPADIANAMDLSFTYGNVTLQSRPQRIRIAGSPVSRPTQACFKDGANNLRGRWYRVDAFNAHGNQTALNPAAQLEYATQSAVADEFGWTFAPDTCALDFFTPQDHLACLAKRSVQFLGDSNLRRLAKSFAAGGDNWCVTSAYDELCQCKDGDQSKGLFDAAGQVLNETRFSNPFVERADPIPWGYDSHMYFDFVGGIQNPHWGNDWQLYFNGSFVNTKIVGKASGLNLIQQRQLQYGDIDFVVLSLIVWDVAAIITPAETLAGLNEFRRALFASYPTSTTFVLRLSNSVCCGTGGPKQRFSSPRFEMWNTLFREFWKSDLDSGKMVLYDASMLSGRQDVALAIPCGAPHLPASHVRIENQFLANVICEKTADHNAQMKAATARSIP